MLNTVLRKAAAMRGPWTPWLLGERWSWRVESPCRKAPPIIVRLGATGATHSRIKQGRDRAQDASTGVNPIGRTPPILPRDFVIQRTVWSYVMPRAKHRIRLHFVLKRLRCEREHGLRTPQSLRWPRRPGSQRRRQRQEPVSLRAVIPERLVWTREARSVLGSMKSLKNARGSGGRSEGTPAPSA